MTSVDLFVIGAGSGGTRAARIAASHGASVMVAEESRIGGTCVVRGCVPKKLLVYASRFVDEFHDAAGFGWSLEGARFDWTKLRDAVELEVTRLSGLYRKGLEGAGVRIAGTRATVEDANCVRLASGEQIRAGRILVATGGWPSLEPAVPGIELAVSSNEMFSLPVLPRRLLVVGGGFIALEFASVFARLGVEVHLVHRGENVLRGFDEDLRLRLRDALGHCGVRLHLQRMLAAIEAQPDGARRVTLSDGLQIEADVVLVATGRRPNTKGLGLEKAGVILSAEGAVVVDGESRSSVPSIYAVGDVTNRVNLTPVAIREGHAFADSVYGGRPWRVDHALVPSAVFTTPELATVGLSEAAAAGYGHEVVVYEADFRPMRATLSGSAERTYMKLVVDRKDERVLGLHMLGEGAAEIVQAAAVALAMGATKADFDRTVALHPTAAEELVTLRTPRKGPVA